MIKKLTVWLEKKVDPVELLFRLIIGGIFIYAGILKVIDISTFELSIRNYKILNDPWVAIVALTLPPLEIITGTCIVFKFLYQGALAVICFILIIFITALTSLLFRNIDINCGCLGLNTTIHIQILIDVSILTACIFLLKAEKKQTKEL